MKVHAKIEMKDCVVEDDFDSLNAVVEFIENNWGNVTGFTARSVSAAQIMQGRGAYLDGKGVIRRDNNR